MANTLSKQGIETGEIIEALHVSQSVDAFTGANAYNIKISGSLNVTGSVLVSGSDLIYSDLPESASNFEALVYDTGSGKVYYTTGSVGLQGVQGVQGASGSLGAQGSQGLQGTVGSLGPQGTQGTSGNFGGASFDYTFTASTDNSDPGTGKIKVNQAIQNTATEMYIDDTDDNGNSIISFLQTIDSVTSAIKGHVRLSNAATSSAFLLYAISDLEIYTGSAYSKLDVSVETTSSAQPFLGGEDVIVSFVTTGDQGTQGTQGAIGASGSGIIENYYNPGDNRIITSVDSASINAENNLQFDGTNLIVSGNIQISGGYLMGEISSSANSTASFGLIESQNIISQEGLFTTLEVDGGNTFLSGSNELSGINLLEGESTSILSTTLRISSSTSITGSVGVSGSIISSGGFTGSLLGTSSLAQNSILLDGKDAATYATTGSNVFIASQIISGSVVIASSEDPGTSEINSTYLFTSASNFDNNECDYYYRNKGTLWDQEWIEYMTGTGLVYGGVVTPSGSSILVKPGGGLIVNYNASSGSAPSTTPSQVKWGAITSSVTYLTSSQFSYLFIDESGSLQQQTNAFTPEQYSTKIPLGVITHLNTASVDNVGASVHTAYGQSNQAGNFIRSFGPLKTSGFSLTPVSSSLAFSASAGSSFKMGGFYPQQPNNPSNFNTSALTSANRIVRAYRKPTAEGGFVADANGGSFYSAIDPSQWDNGSGILQSVGNSEYTIQRAYVGPTSGIIYTYYGQSKYDSLAAAVNNITISPFEESRTTIENLVFIGYFVVKGNTTDLTNTSENSIINSGLFRNTSGASGGGGISTSNLGDLSDVDISVPSNNEFLKYDSGIWINDNVDYGFLTGVPSGIISGSAQLESLGVAISSGSTTSFNSDVTISGSLNISGSTVMSGSATISGSLSSDPIEVQWTLVGSTFLGIIDADQGNYFIANFLNTSGHQINIANGHPGQTINIKTKQNSTPISSLSWDAEVLFASGSNGQPTNSSGSTDVWSAVSFNGSNWYMTGLKDFS